MQRQQDTQAKPKMKAAIFRTLDLRQESEKWQVQFKRESAARTGLQLTESIVIHFGDAANFSRDEILGIVSFSIKSVSGEYRFATLLEQSKWKDGKSISVTVGLEEGNLVKKRLQALKEKVTYVHGGVITAKWVDGLSSLFKTAYATHLNREVCPGEDVVMVQSDPDG